METILVLFKLTPKYATNEESVCSTYMAVKEGSLKQNQNSELPF